MSTPRLSAVRMACFTGRAITGRRLGFSTSTRLGLKETSSQTGVDYDRHKRDLLAKQRQGSGQWKPELATDSEAAVKADRAAAEERMEMLQEKTKRAAEETSKKGEGK